MTHDPRYTCPDCERVVWHQCAPPTYWKGRLLAKLRLPHLRRSVTLGDGFPETREEETAALYENFAGGLPEEDLLRRVDGDG